MSLNHFTACDACKKEVLADDPPHYTRPEFDYYSTSWHGGNPIAPTAETLLRRDLCENCHRRLQQMLLQDPIFDFSWLLDSFEIVNK